MQLTAVGVALPDHKKHTAGAQELSRVSAGPARV